MGLKGSPATSASGSAQKWAQPYATQGAQDVLNVFNAQQPNLDATQAQLGGVNANLGGIGSQLAGQTANYGAQGAAFGKTAGNANNLYNSIIGGSQLSGNPYIQNVLGQLDQSITNQVGSQFESAGRYGSGAYVGDLAHQLGAANGQVLYNNYNDAANRQMQAGQQADQALAAQQNATAQSEQAQNQNSTQQLAGLQLASQVPYSGVNSMGNALGALFNGGTSTGAKPGLLDYLTQAASAGAGAYAYNPSAFSDRRLKKDIVKVGMFDDGLNIYEWTYHFDPSNTRCRGVMADEVKVLRPWAYVENYRDGYAGVNYGALKAA